MLNEKEFEDIMGFVYASPEDALIPFPFLIRPIRMGCNYPNTSFAIERGVEYPYFTLHLVFSGSSFFQIGDHAYLLKKGDAFIITAGQHHRYHNVDDSNLGLLWIELDCSGCHEVIDWLKTHPINVLDATQTQQLTQQLVHLMRTTKTAPPDAFILSGMCYTLIMMLYSALDASTLTYFPTLITNALHYISQHFKENLSIPNLATQLHVSQSTLTKQFKQHIGTSPAHYILLKKIEHAVFLLQTSDVSCDYVAETCGFYDAAHLYKVFTKHLGVPPTSIRVI